MTAPPFDDFLASIDRIGDATVADDPTAAVLAEGAVRLQSLTEVSEAGLGELIAENPQWIRLLGLAVGLSQEQLLVRLHQEFSTRSFARLARQPLAVVQALDELGLLDRITEDRARTYDYSDVLLARYESRATAGRAIGRGRKLEDAVEEIVKGLRLPYQMRTSFVGQAHRAAPCDLAIPEGGAPARVVIGIKGFNSTRSKMTDARREIEEMATIRLPTQFVYIVVDGLAWHSRKSDLRAIHSLWEGRQIDGLYAQATFGRFRDDVADAARILRLALKRE
ncbi:MAG: hypothetical protein ACC726_05695 [Chloroflexota bacterium]